MKLTYKFIFASLLGMVAITQSAWSNPSAQGPEIASSVIEIKTPIIDSQASQNGTAEVFMELTNQGNQNHALIAATSPAADQVQLHTSIMQHGQNIMEQINGITLSTQHEKDLRLGGLHVMLIGLKNKLSVNQSIPITLIFDDGSWTTIVAKIT